MQGATVTVNFNGCGPDVVLSRVQTFPGVSVLCNGPRGVVSAQSNNLGVARFRILGGSIGGSGGALTGCAEIRANSVFGSRVGVAVLDQVGGLDGLKPNDLAAAINDINLGLTVGRSDFDYDGIPRPNDLAILIHQLNTGSSAQNAGAICP